MLTSPIGSRLPFIAVTTILSVAGLLFVALAINLAPMLIIAFLVMTVLAIAWWGLFSPGPLWSRLLLFVLAGSLILGQGFSNIMFGIGAFRLPLSELIVAISLIVLASRVSWGVLFGSKEALIILWCAILPLAVHLPTDWARYGMVALRDATHYVDMWSYFVGIGFAYLIAKGQIQEKAWTRLLVILVVASACYIATYPAHIWVASHSPRMRGYQQYLPVFGYYNMVNVTAYSVLMLAVISARCETWPNLENRKKLLFWMAMICVGGILVMQTRAVFVCLAVAFLFLAFAGWWRETLTITLAAILGLSLLEFANLYGFSLPGKLTSVSFDSFGQMFLSIFGEGELRGAAHGTDQRLTWWSTLLSESVSSAFRIVFGRGFGEALTNFFAPGENGQVIVREPHNSFLSVYARSGLVVLIPWLTFKAFTYTSLLVSFFTLRDNSRFAGFLLWTALFLAACDIRAIVEPVFEFPYGAIPYYFFAGFALTLANGQRRKENDSCNALLDSRHGRF